MHPLDKGEGFYPRLLYSAGTGCRTQLVAGTSDIEMTEFGNKKQSIGIYFFMQFQLLTSERSENRITTKDTR
jgi:hypothetical protein